MGKTVIFEERYGVNVNDFSTTEEIDEVIEKQKGRKLEIVKIDDHGIVPSRGNVFKIKKNSYELIEKRDDVSGYLLSLI